MCHIQKPCVLVSVEKHSNHRYGIHVQDHRLRRRRKNHLKSIWGEIHKQHILGFQRMWNPFDSVGIEVFHLIVAHIFSKMSVASLNWNLEIMIGQR